MQRFVCKHCGMITDNPTIVPHPDKDSYYRDLSVRYEKDWQTMPSAENYWASLWWQISQSSKEAKLKGKYNHSITCPVCLNETRCWRDEPFPADVAERTITISYEEAIEWAKTNSTIENIRARIEDAYKADPTIIHRILFPRNTYTGLIWREMKALNRDIPPSAAGYIRVEYY